MPQRVLSESEFNSLRDQVLAKLPSGLNEADFNRIAPTMLNQAIGEAESSPEPITSSAASRFVSNAWEMLNPATLVKGVWNAAPIPQALGGSGVIEGPKQAVTNIVGQMGEQWGKAKEAASQGNYTEAAARAVTGSVPIVGPILGEVGEQLGQGDVAGVAGKVAGLAAPYAAGRAMSARVAVKGAQKAPLLEREAVEQVAGRVLAPGNPKYRGQAQKIAPEMLARKMSGDRLELQQAALEGMDDAATRIDDAIQAAGGTQAPVPVGALVSDLKSKVADLKDSAGKPLSTQAAKRIQALEDRVYQIQSLGGRKGTVTYEDLKKIRDENYRLADEARGYERQGNPAMSDEGWAARETGSTIRESFAQRSPATAEANADYAFFKTLHKILDPADGRPKSMKPTEGVTGGARTSGAIAGMTLGRGGAFVMSVVLPWWKEQVASTRWQMASAQHKMQLAQAMRKGDIGLMQSVMVKIGKANPAVRATTPTGPQIGQEPVPQLQP